MLPVRRKDPTILWIAVVTLYEITLNHCTQPKKETKEEEYLATSAHMKPMKLKFTSLQVAKATPITTGTRVSAVVLSNAEI
jgi:hypothetical protein